MSRFVIVRRAGRNHSTPDSWVRMDAHDPVRWAPQPSLDWAVRSVQRIGAQPIVQMGVFDAREGRVVWTSDQLAPRQQPMQLDLMPEGAPA